MDPVQRPPSLDTESLPWGRVVAFLQLPEMLSCRLVSTGVASRIHEELLPSDCSLWLHREFRDRNLFFIPGNVDRNWMDACHDDPDVFLNYFVSSNAQSPLDSLLRCLRVCKSIPKEVAVVFSGKFGRHILSIDDVRHVPCGRGKQNCETCRFKIPRKPRPTQKESKLDSVLQIAVSSREILVLDEYFVKCVPNLPRDLICPLCRVTERRTLLLTEMSYPVPEEAAQGALKNMLTFTPSLEPQRKRARTHHPPRFPPLVPDLIIPGQTAPPVGDDSDEESIQHEDFKHALAIHCTNCRGFGIFAPAGLCRGVVASRVDCLGKTRIDCAGGILCRTQCSYPSCMHAASCRDCGAQSDMRCCPDCFRHEEALQWHA
ncbi:hypothetical protein FisN_14Hh271 [Fistulifera solaris]|jgi:hypothetical protein|uniref:Uncharacterized protein n=1 Tax=Fistulifera solaris TaxID=1519565 RepID=A0A1Z5KBN1_FISSO|nr:hypothetical protein FisN_14Hh271 [Fistulifera solaris]|eukprot:GAX23552.1 hypothetical protein FisN_14Hh271 [Fistulifera solaris]